jgi:hypothetical protein
MTETWYRVDRYYDDHITPVEVSRTSDKCVWVGSDRRMKGGEYSNYFQSWAEAHDYLIDRLRSQVSGYESNLNAARSKLSKAMMLQPPVVTQS